MRRQELLPLDPDTARAYDPYLLRMLDVERAARALDLEDVVVETMRHAEFECSFHLPAARLDQAAGVVSAMECRSAHASPAMLELAIAPDGTLNQTRGAALVNDLGCALLELEWRGSAATLVLNHAQHSERETRRLLRGFAERFGRIAPPRLALARIAGANPVVAGWLANDLAESTGGLGMARQVERQAARLAQWIAELARVFARGRALRRAAIQGCAGLGLAVARALGNVPSPQQTEGRLPGTPIPVVMMSDSSGAVVNQDGLDLARLESWIGREQLLVGYAGGEAVFGAELPVCDCDLLVLDAPLQVTAANAGAVRAGLIVECAPDAVSEQAKNTLAARGVEIIPELLVRAGLLLQAAADAGSVALPERRLRALVRQRARLLERAIRQASVTWKCPTSTAALMVAAERLATRIRRGVVV